MRKITFFFTCLLIMSNDVTAQDNSFQKFIRDNFGYRYLINKGAGVQINYPSITAAVDKSEVILFHKLLQQLVKEEQSQKNLKGKVPIGLNGDQADSEHLFQTNTGIELSMGTYPSELDLKARIDINLKNGEFQETFSNLFVSYDRYFADKWEYYVYSRRLSDKFLGLDSRFEVGAGVVFDFRKKSKDRYGTIPRSLAAGTTYQNRLEDRKLYKKVVPDGKTILAKMEMNALDSYSWFSNLFPGNPHMTASQKTVIANKIDAQKIKQIQAVNKEYEKLRFAILLGAFLEIDRFSIDEERLAEFYDTTMISETLSFSKTLEGEFKARIVVRPALTLRTKDVIIKARAFFQLPLWPFEGKRTRHIMAENDNDEAMPFMDSTTAYDYRLDSDLSITLVTKGPFTFTFSYQFLFDNFPAFDFAFADENGVLPQAIFEKNTHHMCRIVAQYNFK